ncbi:hypothetical protein BH11ARM2_BH11ARM2_10280 [soil metagenome]
MKTTRRELLGKTVRWGFVGIVAASLLEGTGAIDPKTGRCDCIFCRIDRAMASRGNRT